MNIFLQGLTMGLAYVAPIGMQNLFVINSALTNKRKRALLTALIVIFFTSHCHLHAFLELERSCRSLNGCRWLFYVWEV